MNEKVERAESLVYTLGTGALSRDQFDEILKENKVSMLVDVRSKPSGWNRGLWRSELVKRYGDNYLWLGDKLGGFDIEENYGSTMWEEGVREIKELSKIGRLVIFCAEDDPERCHRLVIAIDLESEGFKVVHLRGSEYSRKYTRDQAKASA